MVCASALAARLEDCYSSPAWLPGRAPAKPFPPISDGGASTARQLSLQHCKSKCNPDGSDAHKLQSQDIHGECVTAHCVTAMLHLLPAEDYMRCTSSGRYNPGWLPKMRCLPGCRTPRSCNGTFSAQADA